jgi:hypothetical protein
MTEVDKRVGQQRWTRARASKATQDCKNAMSATHTAMAYVGLFHAIGEGAGAVCNA